MRGGWHVVSGHDRADFAYTSQDDRALTVLSGLFGVGRIELAIGFGDRTEILRGQFQSLCYLELARDDHHDVVGLIKATVEVLEVLDRHAFDVRSIADGRLAIVVPFESDGLNALCQDPLRAVFTVFEFVANDGELRHEVFAFDEAIDETIALELDTKLEVLFGGRERFKIVGPVDVGRAVEVRSVVAEGFGDIRESRCTLEDQVFEQVRHAGFAVAFMSRAYHYRHVDADGGAGCVGEQQQPCTVVKAILANPFDARDDRRRGRLDTSPTEQIAGQDTQGHRVDR